MTNDPYNVSGAQFAAPPEDFQIQTQKPNVKFLSRGVQPPSQVYVAQNDDIVVGCASSATGEIVTISYRLLRFDGVLVLGQFQVQPANDRSVKVYQESLAEGFLLSVSCKAKIATTRGITFARIFITDPALGGGQPSYMLMADYVTTTMAPAHPNGRQLAPSEGPGINKIVLSATPPAGTANILDQPTNTRWRVQACWAGLITSAAPGARNIILDVDSAGAVAWQATANAAIAPSVTGFVSGGGVSVPATLNPLLVNVAMPPNVILTNVGRIKLATDAVFAADQWGSMQCLVEEWLDNV